MQNIYGSIGYTILKNNFTKNKIIVMSDMHDKLPECQSNINVSDWFKNKLSTSEILLEEVPRENIKLIELWSDSKHTQSLKNLYLEKPKQIKAIDIRPFLVEFSWEITDPKDKNHNLTLKEYLKQIDEFFNFQHSYFKNNQFYSPEKLINNNLGKHFDTIKNKYNKFKLKNRILLNQLIANIKIHQINILNEVNDILSDIMEWYTCACILSSKNKSIILHTGLAHSENIINWLVNQYDYKIILTQGINDMKQTYHVPLNGCIKLPFDLDAQFGGLNDNSLF
jgi:hypothetical protein